MTEPTKAIEPEEKIEDVILRTQAAAEVRMAQRQCAGMDPKEAMVSCQTRCEWYGHRDVCPRAEVEAQRDELADRLEHGRVPPLHRSLLTSALGTKRPTLRETDCLRLVRAFCRHQPARLEIAPRLEIVFTGQERMMVLSGVTGCGKSLAACYPIATTGGLFVSAPEFRLLDTDQTDDGELVSELLRRARTIPFLVIDDLGTEHDGATGWATGRIADLLCARHEQCLSTILTTNLQRRGVDGEEGVAERYGARVDRRLNDSGRFFGIAVAKREPA